MIFSLLVQAAPYSQEGAKTALLFARSLLQQGHSIYRIFFYMEGVHNASALAVAPQDEISIPHAWTELIDQYRIDSVVCIAAAIRRGILDAEEAKRYGKAQHNLAAFQELSGLGQFVEAVSQSDRIINFGG